MRFGGVISVRTRTVAPQSPFAARFSGTLGAGIPDRRAGIELSDGFSRGGVLFAAHTRDVDDYDGPDGEVFNSGYSDHGFLARGTHQLGPGLCTAGWQSDFGRDIERPRNNSQTVRFYYPTEDSHRLTVGYDLRDSAGFSRVHVHRLCRLVRASHRSGSVCHRHHRPQHRARRRQRQGFSGARTRSSGCSAAPDSKSGVDVNGRYGLRALDILESYDACRRARAPDRERLGGLGASRRHRRLRDRRRRRCVDAVDRRRHPRRLRHDRERRRILRRSVHVERRRLGLSSRSPPAASAASARPSRSRAASAIRCCRIATSAARQGAGSSPAIPISSPRSSLQFDLGLRYTAPRLRAATYFYHYRIDDLIERYSTQTDFFFFRNRGRARLRGFEAEAQAELGWGLLARIGLPHRARPRPRRRHVSR